MSSSDVQIAPSVLPADFSRLGEVCQTLEEAGVDRIHWDVMDGVFVPNLTFGPDIIHSCRSKVEIPFEAHLMVVNADDLIPRYVEAGCDLIIVHQEACVHLHRTLSLIRDLGARPAVALNPSTPAITVEHVMDLVEEILVMTVNPGFGGQSYISTMEGKVREVSKMIATSGRDIDLEVDGGISGKTVGGASAAGADVFVAGSAVFNDPEGFTHAVSDIRRHASSARG